MGYTSKEQRWAIVTTWKQTGSVAAAARQTELSQKVVQRWVQRYQASGDVLDAPKAGRKPILSAAAALQAHDLLLGNQYGGAKSVGQQLYTSGHASKPVDRRTVTRAAVKLAKARGVRIRALRGKPRKGLTAATKQKWLQFCKSNLKKSWGNVMFTDRKKFPFSYPGVKVQAVSWAEEGTAREAYTVNHAQVVNLYAGISRYGVTKLHVVAGTSKHKTPYKNKKGVVAKNITSQEYHHVVRATFMPEGQRMFSTQGLSTWVLQQDNDPTHKAALPEVDAWNEKHASSISVLQPWPPNSPDLNPIENFWSYLQAKLAARGCATFDQFKAAVKMEAKAVPKDYFSKLVGSMPKRLTECIALGGGKTKY